MPKPTENKQPVIEADKKLEESDLLSFLDEPVQKFDTPDLPESEKEEQYDHFEVVEDKPTAKAPKTPEESSGMASRYVKLFDKGFSNIAAVYASGNTEDFKIDQDDQNDLADPLAELIADNKILDLPPGWALVVTAGIIYAPLIMKAVGSRRDHKALAEKEPKKEVKTVIVEEEKDTA